MLSELRKQKYHFVFAVFWDSDHNGKIDNRDLDVLTERMCEHKHYNKKELRQIWQRVFDGMLKYIGLEGRNFMYYDEWITVWSKFAENATEPEWYEVFKEYVFQYYADDNGVITYKSRTPGFVPFGIDEEEAKMSFKKISPNKTTVNREEFMILLKEFFTTDDPDAPGNFAIGKIYF